MITIRPIVPRRLRQFLPSAHRQAIERTQALGVEAAKAEIGRLTASWSRPPEVHETRQGDGVTIEITDERWLYNDLGTRPHLILPRRRKVLKFTVGGSVVFARRVNHPGTKAQYLTRQVQRRVDALNLAQTFTDIVGGLTR